MQDHKWTEFVRDMRAEAARVFGTRLAKRDRLTLDDEDDEVVVAKIRGFSTAREPVLHCVPATSQHDVDPTIYVDAVERQLDNMYKMGQKIIRQFGQVTFHSEIIKILLPVIFGSKWNQYKDVMRVRYKIDKEYQTCFIMSSRQVGKAEGIAMLVAALAAHVPNIKIAVFAQTEATAQALTARVYQYLLNIPGIETRITAHNMSGVTLTFHAADQRKVICYALTEGTRGFSAPVVIVDEMAFVGEKALKETVYPVLRNSPSALIGCSTPEGPDNFFSSLINAKDSDGQPLHKFVNLRLVCDACLELPEELQGKCTHMNHMRVEWHSTKGDALISSLIGSASTAARELAGVPISRDSARFPRTNVLRTLVTNARVDVANELFSKAYITCDPSGGGNSDLAFWAGVYHNSHIVVSRVCVLKQASEIEHSIPFAGLHVLGLVSRVGVLHHCLQRGDVAHVRLRVRRLDERVLGGETLQRRQLHNCASRGGVHAVVLQRLQSVGTALVGVLPRAAGPVFWRSVARAVHLRGRVFWHVVHVVDRAGNIISVDELRERELTHDRDALKLNIISEGGNHRNNVQMHRVRRGQQPAHFNQRALSILQKEWAGDAITAQQHVLSNRWHINAQKQKNDANHVHVPELRRQSQHVHGVGRHRGAAEANQLVN